MKNISTSRLSFWSGVFAEIIACVSVVLCLGYDASAPSPAAIKFVSFVSMLHMPGFLLGALLAKVVGVFIILPLVILVGMLSFALLFWVSISLWRWLSPSTRPDTKSLQPARGELPGSSGGHELFRVTVPAWLRSGRGCQFIASPRPSSAQVSGVSHAMQHSPGSRPLPA